MTDLYIGCLTCGEYTHLGTINVVKENDKERVYDIQIRVDDLIYFLVEHMHHHVKFFTGHSDEVFEEEVEKQHGREPKNVFIKDEVLKELVKYKEIYDNGRYCRITVKFLI